MRREKGEMNPCRCQGKGVEGANGAAICVGGINESLEYEKRRKFRLNVFIQSLPRHQLRETFHRVKSNRKQSRQTFASFSVRFLTIKSFSLSRTAASKFVVKMTTSQPHRVIRFVATYREFNFDSNCS
jgi:hypothetical protein